MPAYRSKDTQLLQEAYSLQLLKENFPQMTLAQVTANLPIMSLSESQYVDQFSERVINELFGGLRGIGKSAGNSIKKAGGGIMSGIGGLGRGVKDAASQVGQNFKDVYNSSEDEDKFNKGAERAKKTAEELVALVKDAQSKGLVTFSGDPMTMPLADLIDELMLAKKGSKQISGSHQRRGLGADVGKSFKKGFSQ